MPRKKKARPEIAPAEYVARRRELAALMDEGCIAVIPGAKLKIRNCDVEYRFRQNSDFRYLTGFDEPDAVFVLIPGRENGEALLFCRERDNEHERWHGHITGPERAMQFFGMDDAFPISDIGDILPGLMEGQSKLYYSMGVDRDFDTQVIDWAKKISQSDHLGAEPSCEFVQLDYYLHELRLFKSPAEIALMKLAADATVKGHRRIMQKTQPGMMEYELEAELIHEFSINGARDCAYPAIVGGGANACVLHYVSNNDVLADGDLVLVDAGGEYEGYACDLTRTFPVNGRFSDSQARVYEVVLRAQEAAIAAVRPGNTWNDPHEAAINELSKGLVILGVLSGNLDNLISQEAYLRYCMTKTGHWLGLDVHDVGDYKVNGQWRVFEEGMVTTIEPGVYFNQNMMEVPKEYRGIGVRIEDDVLVTKSGNEVLTVRVPRTVGEIETLMGAASV